MTIEIDSHATSPAHAFPIVAIGASAGGFEAFLTFLRSLPDDTGMAYVFVQHLDPNHESIAGELLSKATKMPVANAVEGMPVHRNRVYLLPPNKTLIVKDGHLGLLPRGGGRGPHMPVDYFMRSLAEIHGNRAIGVVLSGTGSDGTLGVKAIKEEGGITFAQDPQTAKYDGMPRMAISSNCIDHVLPVEAIARELVSLSQSPYVRSPSRRMESPDEGQAEVEIPDTLAAATDELSYDRIFAILKKTTGVDFKAYKHTTIRRRILRRMVVHKQPNMAEYLKLLQNDPAEVQALYQDLLIKVTRFFRDPAVFDFLKSTIFPALFQNRSGDAPVRIWVPGCSTGEEVYSIAICLLEYMGDAAVNPPVQFFATDISEVALQTARDGRYIDNIAMDVSPDRLRRFFSQVDSFYQICKPIRDLCIFARQNMTSDPPFSKLDMISCRNVLIYFDSKLQKRAISLFHYALKPSGYLLLGPSETTGQFSELFSLVDKHHKIYSKSAADPRVQMEFSRSSYLTESVDGLSLKPQPAGGENLMVQDAQRDADRIILSKFSASGVVIDQNMNIVQFRGDTTRYLEHLPGEPSLNLLKMARGNLGIELRSLIHEARNHDNPAVKENVPVAGTDVRARLEVTPLHVPSDKGSFFLVLFEVPALPPATLPAESSEETTQGADVLARRVRQLTAELTATKQHLQSIIEEHEATNEELQSANEEVLSSNEELQSINEELETAKEELQSTNEELTTVNEELQHRNVDLHHLNNDLTNLLSSVSIPIVMLGADLRIRRFTPMAEKILSLIPTDVGRPISDIKPRIAMPDLEKLVADVVDNVIIKELDVQDKDGKWFSMRIRPYKTTDNKIDGAVIAIVDIDALKRSVVQLKETTQFFDASLQVLREPVVMLDLDLNIRKANASFYRVCGMRPEEAEGQSIFLVAHARWNVAELRTALQSINSAEKPGIVTDLPLRLTTEHRGVRDLLVNARRVDIEGLNDGRILVAIEDVTKPGK